MALVTITQLATITREVIAEDDEFALEVIRLAEEAVLDYLDLDELPVDASVRAARRVKRVALLVAKRGYLNPDQIKHEGNVGPIGGDTYDDDFAAGLDLTEGEEAELDRADIPGAHSGIPRLHVIKTTVPTDVIAPDLYLPDYGPGGATDDFLIAGWEDRGAYGL